MPGPCPISSTTRTAAAWTSVRTWPAATASPPKKSWWATAPPNSFSWWPGPYNPSRALIVAPAFSEYQEALEAARVPFDFHLTSEADRFTLAEFPQAPGAGLVFLANPASPSGALTQAGALLPWLEKWHAAGVYVALDEAFIDFVEEASAKVFLPRFPRLIILRSFTKFFAIPGLRLGYLLAAPELIERLAVMQEPWSVNTLAQAVGRACLADRDYMAQTRAFVAAARRSFFGGIRSPARFDALPRRGQLPPGED